MLAQSSSGGGGGGGHTAAKTSHAHATSFAAKPPSPVVEAINAAISAHAAQHVLNVVQHHHREQAARHAAHATAHHQSVHLGANPLNPHISNMLAKFAQQEVAQSMAHPQYDPSVPLMWNGHAMIPAPQAPGGGGLAVHGGAQVPQGYQGQGQYAGNNSIANPDQGGDSGIMGLLQGLFGG